MFIDDRVVKSFVKRIRENLLDFDLDRKLHHIEATNALASGHNIHVGGHQNAIVKRFQPHIQVHPVIGTNANYGVAKALNHGRINLMLAHFARTVHEVEHRNSERGNDEVGHNRQFYALWLSTPAAPKTSRRFATLSVKNRS